LRRLTRQLEIDLKQIELLIFDVDGVMTDNRIDVFSGRQEGKRFSVADGFAFKIARHGPLKFALISARYAEPTVIRGTELGIKDIYQQPDKIAALNDLLSKYDLSPSQVGMVGNDFPDTLLMEKVGLAIVTADCEPEITPYAHYQTDKNGGDGCCREVINFVLKAKDVDLMNLYREWLKQCSNGQRK